jgi:glucose/arabinose dehydrogenase
MTSGMRVAVWRVMPALVLPLVILLLLFLLLQAFPGPFGAARAQEQGVSLASGTFTPTDWVYLPILSAGGGPVITLTEQVDGLEKPTHVTHAGDGTGRLFVTEKPGRIRVVRGGTLLVTPFLSITDRVRSAGGEQGLLSVAFPPGYEDKGYFYVDYTDNDGDTVVARYHLTADPDVADPGSEEVILTQTQPFGNHNGGQLAFGPDGYLYIGLGDGGGGGDPEGNAQDPTSLLGKLLRIDVESGAMPYAIPSSNPYTETAQYENEIWALGLRNPWRFSFDGATGDLYIGDVGQNDYEEIDFQPASSGGGENYGWNIMEGMHCYSSATCDQTGLVLPVVEYDHSVGCSVTGGMVYRGTGNPNMDGIYFYGDYCSGRIWGLFRQGGAWDESLLADTDLTISSFGEDEAGNLYVADFGRGAVYQITEAP